MSDLTQYDIDVHLLDTHTGERRVYRDEYGYDVEGEFNDHPWREGNYACDCNRSLFWGRAVGREDPDPLAFKCNTGPNRFVVEKIVRVRDGRVVYSEPAPVS